MLTKEENDLLTQTGRGTPCGELMRRYWQPAALSEELPPGGPPIPVHLLGEELVLFRDQQGRPGLLGLHCSHRGADLSYGRIEDGGLRCIYHGWLYDIHGRCLEQPGEPTSNSWTHSASNSWTHWGGRDSIESSTSDAQAAGLASQPGRRRQDGPAERQRLLAAHTAYPCQERGGVIFAYLGPGEPPLLPNYEFLCAPDGHWSSTKTFQDCNYLQGNEGNFDPVHLSFLHQIWKTERSEDAVRQTLNRRNLSPIIEPEQTDYGLRIYAIRPMGETNYVRVTNFILPNLSAVAGNADGYQVNWHVPIDDTHHWRFGISFRRSAPISAGWRSQARADKTPDYHLTRNRGNRYLQDREEIKTRTFIGLGDNFILHDTCATEGAGPIQDRTQEHLGYTDRGIIASRQVLLRAVRDIQEGREPPHVVRDPSANHFPHIVARNDVVLPSSVDWHEFWEKEGVELRETRELVGQVIGE